MVQIKFKKLNPLAILPTKEPQDSGWDLYCVEDFALHHDERVVGVTTGLQLADLTPGYELHCRSRSGNAVKKSVFVIFGTVDNGYRGELKVMMKALYGTVFFKKGDKIGQLVPMAIVDSEVVWSKEVSETKRGQNGFGSTDLTKGN